LSAGQRASTPVAHQEIWRDATRYIDEHVSHELSVTEIARAALTSERQLQRVFAIVGTTTVRAYVLRARMGRATALLLRTNAPVSQVATAVGYGHVSAFTKAFRLHHGVTPSELRQSGAM
jgi:AraC family transcriptional regulator